MTGGKRKQPERLSERTRKGCDSLNRGITKEASEGRSKNQPRHRKVVSKRKLKVTEMMNWKMDQNVVSQTFGSSSTPYCLAIHQQQLVS